MRRSELYAKITDPVTRRVVAGVLRLDDRAHIPADPANIDWQAYQAWLKAGNTPAEPSDAAPPSAPLSATSSTKS